MIRRPPRSTRTDNSFPTRRSSDLLCLKRRRGFERLVGERPDGGGCRSGWCWQWPARRGDQKEWSTSRKARLLRSSLQAGANRQGSDKIDQLAESVRANSDGHVGAFHLVEDQQPGGDHGSMLDERTFDSGIEPKRTWPLQDRQRVV